MDFSQVCRQKGLTFQDLRAQGQRIPQEHLFHNSTPKGFKISKGVQSLKFPRASRANGPDGLSMFQGSSQAVSKFHGQGIGHPILSCPHSQKLSKVPNVLHRGPNFSTGFELKAHILERLHLSVHLRIAFLLVAM